MSFQKQAKTYAEQLEILKGRGLVVEDEAFALRCLEHHNYYRLSAYRFPLVEPRNPDKFMAGTTFSSLWQLYNFDRRLRLLVSEAVKRVEISARSRWAYVLGHAHGSQAFEKPDVFHDLARHAKGLAQLDEEIERSDEVFIKHYKDKYRMSRPPVWAVCEIMSFGLLSRFYANLARFKDLKEIARTYKLFPETLKSFLEHAVYVRNLCAHHSRLWNRRFTVTVALPTAQPMEILSSLYATNNPAEDRRIYNTLVLLTHMLDVIEPDNTWGRRLFDLLTAQSFPVTSHMGFPADWLSRPVWVRFKE